MPSNVVAVVVVLIVALVSLAFFAKTLALFRVRRAARRGLPPPPQYFRVYPGRIAIPSPAENAALAKRAWDEYERRQRLKASQMRIDSDVPSLGHIAPEPSPTSDATEVDTPEPSPPCERCGQLGHSA